jgi:hypothetical protein
VSPPAWGLGEELRTLHRKESACYEMLHGNEASGCIKGGEFLD